MKISILYCAFSTVVSIKAAAITNAISEAPTFTSVSQSECFASGRPCTVLRRAAEAAAEAMAEADQGTIHRCFLNADHCMKAKRDALAFAEAAAEAAALAEPEADQGKIHHCFINGGHCVKAKRDVLAAAEASAEAKSDVSSSTQLGK